jgi:hypothetical protein
MDISAIALQGVEGAQSQFDRAASRFSPAASPASGDLTDLSQPAVDLLSAKDNFEANLKLLKVGDEMERTAIDLLA